MRYHGKIGLADQKEISPGVWDDVITEVERFGTVVQSTETFDQVDSILPRVRTTTSVSVLDEGVLIDRQDDIRYVWFRGKRWSVASIVTQYPRIVIYLGERYNGPSATAP